MYARTDRLRHTFLVTLLLAAAAWTTTAAARWRSAFDAGIGERASLSVASAPASPVTRAASEKHRAHADDRRHDGFVGADGLGDTSRVAPERVLRTHASPRVARAESFGYFALAPPSAYADSAVA